MIHEGSAHVFTTNRCALFGFLVKCMLSILGLNCFKLYLRQLRIGFITIFAGCSVLSESTRFIYPASREAIIRFGLKDEIFIVLMQLLIFNSFVGRRECIPDSKGLSSPMNVSNGMGKVKPLPILKYSSQSSLEEGH